MRPTPTSTPSPSITAAPGTDVLFTISANARSIDGSRVGIRLAAHSPLSDTDPGADALRAQFLANCPTDGQGNRLTGEALGGSSLMELDLTSNRPGQTFIAPIQLYLGSPYTLQSVTGSGIVPPPTAVGCDGIYTWMTSEPAHALLEFPNNPAGSEQSVWRFAHYGFVVAPSSGVTIESCNVAITDLGQHADPGAVAGWDPSQAATGATCGIGYSGE